MERLETWHGWARFLKSTVDIWLLAAAAWDAVCASVEKREGEREKWETKPLQLTAAAAARRLSGIMKFIRAEKMFTHSLTFFDTGAGWEMGKERKFGELHIIHVNENVTIKRHKLVREEIFPFKTTRKRRGRKKNNRVVLYIATIWYSVDVSRSWSFQNPACAPPHSITAVLLASHTIKPVRAVSGLSTYIALKMAEWWNYFSNHIVRKRCRDGILNWTQLGLLSIRPHLPFLPLQFTYSLRNRWKTRITSGQPATVSTATPNGNPANFFGCLEVNWKTKIA